MGKIIQIISNTGENLGQVKIFEVNPYTSYYSAIMLYIRISEDPYIPYIPVISTGAEYNIMPNKKNVFF